MGDQICSITDLSVDNMFVKFGRCLFLEGMGTHMVANCAPLLADLFIYLNEKEFLDSLGRTGQRRLARSQNLCYKYIDDLMVFNKKGFTHLN